MEDQNERVQGNVLFFQKPVRKREPAPTDQEILEYRRIRPYLLKMLEEWSAVRTNCPLARRILDGD